MIYSGLLTFEFDAGFDRFFFLRIDSLYEARNRISSFLYFNLFFFGTFIDSVGDRCKIFLIIIPLLSDPLLP